MKDRQKWRLVRRSLLQSGCKMWHPSMVIGARGDRELPRCPKSPLSLFALYNGRAQKLVGSLGCLLHLFLNIQVQCPTLAIRELICW